MANSIHIFICSVHFVYLEGYFGSIHKCVIFSTTVKKCTVYVNIYNQLNSGVNLWDKSRKGKSRYFHLNTIDCQLNFSIVQLYVIMMELNIRHMNRKLGRKYEFVSLMISLFCNICK